MAMASFSSSDPFYQNEPVSSRHEDKQHNHIFLSPLNTEIQKLQIQMPNTSGLRRTSTSEDDSSHHAYPFVLHNSSVFEATAGYSDNLSAMDTMRGSGTQQERQANVRKRSSAPKGARGRYGCRTCRQRHLKCDENRPACNHCTKARRECLWNHEIRMSHDRRSSSSSTTRPPVLPSVSSASPEDWLNHRQSNEQNRRVNTGKWLLTPSTLRQLDRDEYGNYLANISTCEWAPSELLKSCLEGALFQFYIEHGGPWLDITSPSRHFALTVPRLAMSNPVLLFACLSYSARSLMPSSSLSEQYTNACIKLLIPLLSDESFVSTDETLLATLVILRHVEQYAEAPEDKGAHLSGAFSLIASQRVLPSHDSLPGAALWTYMRQDVRKALLSRTSPKLTPSHGIQVENFGTVAEGTWADRACHLAALACTYAWGGTAGEVNGDHLDQWLDWWRNNLPQEYQPYHDTEESTMYLASWHGVAWQFYHLARILLKLYRSDRPRDMDVFAFSQHIESEVTTHAQAICKIVYSTSDVGCIFNASAILGFAGSYFRDAKDQNRLISFMRNFSAETNWPTAADQERLANVWQSASKTTLG